MSRLSMGGETFSYDGRTGGWACAIYRVLVEGDGFCAVADITLRGEQRCKLLLRRPHAAGDEDIELLKQKCAAWIERAEKEAARLQQ